MDALLDFEKRTGISDTDLSDFEKKTNEIARLVTGLKDGSIDPYQLDVPDPREEKRKEDKRKQKARIEKIVAKHNKDKEECETWWTRAETLCGKSRKEAKAQRDAVARGTVSKVKHQNEKEQSTKILDDDGNILFPRPKQECDVLDYTVWDKWIPDDPVSLEEMQRAKEKIEDERNLAFEQANPEFCNQFKEDQEKRRKANEKKEQDNEKLRLRGNQLFKRKKYLEALKCYMDALESMPWSVSIIGNIAQVYLRQKNYERALEFSERALFLEPENVKALWRHSRACIGAGVLEEAVNDLKFAAIINPDDEEISDQLAKAEQKWSELQAENNVVDKVSKLDAPTSTSLQSEQAVAEALTNPTGTLMIPRRMCNEVAAIDENSPGTLTTTQKLAVNGLNELFISSNSEETAELCVLLRTSGALEKLCRLAQKLEGNDFSKGMHHLMVRAIASNSRNETLVLEEKQLLKGSLESESLALKRIQLVAAFVEYPKYRVQVAAYRSLYPALVEALNSKQLFADAVDIVCNLCASPESRERFLIDMGPLNLDKVLKRLNEAVPEKDAVAALANAAQDVRVVDALDYRPLLETALGPIGNNQKQRRASDTARAFALTGLINLTIDKGHELREKLANDTKCLENLYELATKPAGRPQIICTRSAALLSRILADPKHGASASRSMLRLKPNVLDDVSTLMENTTKNSETSPWIEHLIRFLAGLLRNGGTQHLANSKDPKPFVASIAKVLDSQAKLARSGDRAVIKSKSQIATNIAQCFLQLCSEPKLNQLAVIREKVIPCLIHLLQYTEDGPVRKNAAITLAKLAQSGQDNMKVIRQLRGMEMLVELGDRLV